MFEEFDVTNLLNDIQDEQVDAVSFYNYTRDRVCDTYQMSSLASLIAEKAEELPLRMSWQPPPS
jgi:hypothetical protein